MTYGQGSVGFSNNSITPTGGVTGAENGLYLSGNKIRLGGILTEDTFINGNSTFSIQADLLNAFSISSLGNLRLDGDNTSLIGHSSVIISSLSMMQLSCAGSFQIRNDYGGFEVDVVNIGQLNGFQIFRQHGNPPVYTVAFSINNLDCFMYSWQSSMPNGGTVAPGVLRFGNKASNPGRILDTTNYIEISINNKAYKLALVN